MASTQTTCHYCGLPTPRGYCDDCGTVPAAFAQMGEISREAAARIRAAHEAAQIAGPQPCDCTDTTICARCAW